MSDSTDDTHKTWQWKPGQSGNPKGSRYKLSEAFIADLCRSWKAHGKKVIAKVVDEKADVYLRLVASVVSKDLESKSGGFDDLADAELAALIVAARAALKASERAGSPGDDES